MVKYLKLTLGLTKILQFIYWEFSQFDWAVMFLQDNLKFLLNCIVSLQEQDQYSGYRCTQVTCSFQSPQLLTCNAMPQCSFYPFCFMCKQTQDKCLWSHSPSHQGS